MSKPIRLICTPSASFIIRETLDRTQRGVEDALRGKQLDARQRDALLEKVEHLRATILSHSVDS